MARTTKYLIESIYAYIIGHYFHKDKDLASYTIHVAYVTFINE